MIIEMHGPGYRLVMNDHGGFTCPDGSKAGLVAAGMAPSIVTSMPPSYQAGLATQWREAEYVAAFLGLTIDTTRPPSADSVPDGAIP